MSDALYGAAAVMAVDGLIGRELSVGWHVGTHRRQIASLAMLAVLASAVFAGLLALLGVVSPVLLLVIAVLLATIYQPRYALYVTLTLVLLFENVSADELMVPGRYFSFGLQATLGLSGFIISPLEILLIVALMAWLVQGIVRGDLQYRGGGLGWPMLLFAVALVAGVIRGQVGGGNLYIAFWEVRSLIYTVACYVLVVNTLHNRQHLVALTLICLIATGVYAIEGAYRKFALIDTGEIVGDMAYSHEMVIFIGTALLIVVAQATVRTPAWQRMIGLALTPIMIFTLLASQRRAGYIAVAVAFVAFAFVFLVSNRKAFFLLAVPTLVGMAIYLPLFWNDTSMLGQPARAVRSLYQPDQRDASSNVYRELEKINVRETIRANPLLGVGFGQPYYFVVPLPDLSFWPFWYYQPHHNILWVWLKIGAPGFIAFWTMMGTALTQAARVSTTARDPVIRTFGLMTLAGLVTTLIFCYVDLGLTFSRVTVFLGTLMGALAVVEHLPERDTA